MRSGIKSTEFWLTLLAQLVAAFIVLATLLWGEGHWAVAMAGAVSAALAGMGYSAARAKTKAADAIANAAEKGGGASPSP